MFTGTVCANRFDIAALTSKQHESSPWRKPLARRAGLTFDAGGSEDVDYFATTMLQVYFPGTCRSSVSV